ncbi:Bax inhibitor-1/YccA family protein [Longirhabdus pacifica]|uniref:Bax inhibitor-1/YccA family protein n=1 Tax=Longirhabdus pacifica TaxID=2305227 RepID=UPI001008EEF7|nr:Bax inhibitor-1/YccA family protein [Longirhabdus pacifica]
MSSYQQGTYTEQMDQVDHAPFHRLMRMFTISLLISFIGTFVGYAFLPPELIVPLIFVELAMIIASLLIARKGKAVGYTFVYTFCFISGITLYLPLAGYIASGGAALVLTALTLTILIYASLTIYAYNSERDFSFLRGFLMTGLIALIVLGIMGIFFPSLYGGTIGLAIAFGGVMIFSGFILYDVSQYKHGVPDKLMPLAVLSLYLNFINLFLYLLRLLNILSSDDE